MQGSISDKASSMIGTLNDFEGAPCVDHKLPNAIKHASRGAFIFVFEKSYRGIVAHFRRSGKVKHHILCQHCIEPNVIINFMFALAGYEQVARVKCSYNTSQPRIRGTMGRYDRHLHLDWQALGYIGVAIRGALRLC